MGERPWRTLVEMDAVYARSRRRAELRRARDRRRTRVPPQLKRAALIAVVLFLPLAELRVPSTSAVPKPEAARSAPTAAESRCPMPARFRRSFVRAAGEANLPLPLLVSVAYEESRFDPNARSPVGAHGLLQLMPVTAQELKLDVSDPETNVLAGARYLRKMLDRFGDVDLALAAYNAGPTAVARAGGAPSGVTLRYVANVRATWAAIAGCT